MIAMPSSIIVQCGEVYFNRFSRFPSSIGCNEVYRPSSHMHSLGDLNVASIACSRVQMDTQIRIAFVVLGNICLSSFQSLRQQDTLLTRDGSCRAFWKLCGLHVLCFEIEVNALPAQATRRASAARQSTKVQKASTRDSEEEKTTQVPFQGSSYYNHQPGSTHVGVLPETASIMSSLTSSWRTCDLSLA
jgi:hypothetical protein